MFCTHQIIHSMAANDMNRDRQGRVLLFELSRSLRFCKENFRWFFMMENKVQFKSLIVQNENWENDWLNEFVFENSTCFCIFSVFQKLDYMWQNRVLRWKTAALIEKVNRSKREREIDKANNHNRWNYALDKSNLPLLLLIVYV